MTLGRWDEIMHCLHLVDNSSIVRDVNDPRFDRIAKTRWLVEMFVKVSKDIYNLESEITVDECVIPYKGSYYFIHAGQVCKVWNKGVAIGELQE